MTVLPAMSPIASYPEEDWDRLMGSSGFALVRGGAVVTTQVCRMN